VARLADSGVGAGSYGLAAAASPSPGGSFNVPYLTVDAKGRVTAAATYAVTLPLDTKVKQTAKSDNVNYRILLTTLASPTSGTAYEANYGTNLAYNPSTNTLSTGNASLTGTLNVTG
jgi:hypothetical protein